jgi:protein-S-isoprenylcysteine O-methyltransferase Ste14
MEVLPFGVTRILLALSVLLLLWGRFSLGRNIGSVPAERGVVTSGAYAFIRHPIHVASILFAASFLFEKWSALNALVFAIGAAFVLYKSVIEERFLIEDHAYRQYCQRVPYRWIPHVI